MLKVINVSKRYRTKQGWKQVFSNISFSVAKGEKIGIFGKNGAGKSTLVRLISGVEPPTSGFITREMSVSWPLAFSGAFQSSLTGLDNLRFICRVYNIDIEYAHKFVLEFSELGYYLYEPVKTYSSGMKARLGFAVSLCVEFDCYLIDEVIAVGDKRFSDKCKYELFEKRKNRSIILISHSLASIKEYCDKAAVLHKGYLYNNFTSIDEAYKFHTSH